MDGDAAAMIHASGGVFNRNVSGNTGTITGSGTFGSVGSCTLPDVT
jgi:hypothetical protein